MAFAIALTQAVVVSLLFEISIASPTGYVRHTVRALVAAAVAFLLLAWPRRERLLQQASDAGNSDLARALLVNAVLFAALAAASMGFTAYTAATGVFSWPVYALYLGLLAAVIASLANVLAPVRFWLAAARSFWPEALVSVAIGSAIILAETQLSATLWYEFSGVTLTGAATILKLLGLPAFVDMDQRLLALREFAVTVEAGCSGYEGMALVGAFLLLFFYTFRNSLRFPNALILLPIGLGSIWLLNIVRISLLVVVGAYLSPEMAVKGFHSQAGWMAFLATACGLLVLATRSNWLFTDKPRLRAADPSQRVMAAFLVPFMALMGAHIVISATAPHGVWLSPLKPIAVMLCLFHYRDVYRDLLAHAASRLSMVAGIAVGLAWAATDPGGGPSEGLGLVLQENIGIVALYLGFSALTSVFLVPIAEELAFRGVLYRWIISRDFNDVAFDRVSLLGMLVSSVLFGLMHQRWIAGALAGVVFTLVMWHRARLSDAIACHVLANATILAWAIVFQRWSLIGL